jgi:hypothetical protein
MGRILFLSAVAFMAYKYIARSNQRHQQVPEGDNKVEVLPPSPAASEPKNVPKLSAVESDREAQKRLVAVSSAVEPDPRS